VRDLVDDAFTKGIKVQLDIRELGAVSARPQRIFQPTEYDAVLEVLERARRIRPTPAGVPAKLPEIADISQYEGAKVTKAVDDIDDLLRLAELEARKEAREFPQTLLFTVWDYKEGQLKKGVDNLLTAPHFRGIPLDVKMGEYGYTDYNEFLRAIEQQVSGNRIIRFLKGGYPIPVPEDTTARLFAWLDGVVSPAFRETQDGVLQVGQRVRGDTLLNYGNRLYADYWLGTVFPYEFWG